MAKIKTIYFWYGDNCGIAQVYYDTGAVKKYSNRYQAFPKTVEKFMDSHTREKENSQCWKYEED